MARIAKSAVIVMLAAGVALGGCATRESVENAQASANAADRHAAVAQGRAEEAYGLGDRAMATGVDARNMALTADQKADQAAADLAKAKKRIAYLESKVLPKKKYKKHRAAAPARRDSNS